MGQELMEEPKMVQSVKEGQGHHAPQVVVHYNKDQFKFAAEGNPYKGQALREAFGVGAEYDLYRRDGNKAEIINPEDQVTLKNGDHFFSVIRQSTVG